MIKNLIFDWSGTISDDIEIVFRSTMAVFDFLKIKRITIEEYKREFCLPYMDFYHKYCPTAVKKDQDHVFIQHISTEPLGKAYPGIPKMLKQLHEAGIKMAVLTSNPHDRTIEEAKLIGEQYFIKYLTAVHDKTKVMKDYVDELGLNPNETAYVGDMVHDIDAGKAAGIKTIAVTWGYNNKQQLMNKQPDYVIDTPERLLNICGVNGNNNK
ncbi:MAG: HAD family hydrolase [Nanoarchaeota archaeon]|nr:HAD family hydrolase [Nanoarchaeota archaeon]